jgi:hypothetical protein
MKSLSSYPKCLSGSIPTLTGFISLAILLACLPSVVARQSAQLKETYSNLPLSFEINRGQTDPQVKFLSRGAPYNLFLTSNEAVLQLRDAAANPLRMKLVGANPKSEIEGLDPLPGKSNYFIGADPKQWRTGIPHYGKVKYKDVYPGISIVYYGNQRQLEYDFVVAPGADPGRIRFKLDGARRMRVDRNGDLAMETAAGEARSKKPVIYQESGGARQPIAGKYLIIGGNQIGFQVGEYDATRPLVIDPVLVYSTYVGGSGEDVGYGIAVDGGGNAYVTGVTASLDFPTANPLQPASGGGSHDAFVLKLNAAGTTLVYATYLGGSGTENFNSRPEIALDSSGAAYLTGYTNSANFPVVNAFQAAKSSGDDAFLVKLNASGSAILYSSFLGGGGNDYGIDITTDASGKAYVAGVTFSNNFPTTSGAFQGNQGGADAFVTKIDPSQTGSSSLVYSTYLGGNLGDDAGDGIVVDTSGNAYVTGHTRSTDFPTANAYQPSLAGSPSSGVYPRDAFVTKLNASGTSIIYSTFLGGSGEDEGQAVAIDSAGNAYVTGNAASADFPATASLQPAYGGGVNDCFVAKLGATGSSLVYSTYLGGSGNDGGFDLTVDASGNAYVVGFTGSTNFPTANAIQASYGGSTLDAFAAKLNPAGAALVYSTYLGGSSVEVGRGVAVDAVGSAYVTGNTFSTNFPTANPLQAACAPNSGGFCSNDVFVAKIADNRSPVANAGADQTVECAGSLTSVTLNGSGSSDPDGDVLTYEWREGTTLLGTGVTLNASLALGPHTITLTVSDPSNASSQDTVVINVVNTAPPVVTITGPASGAIYAVNTPVIFTGNFSDNAGGTHTATWTFDSVSVAGTVNETTGEVTATHSFTSAGVYLISLTVSDGCGGAGSSNTVGGFDAMVVVYDPNGGFVTGGGWINSPAGAYTPNPALAGKANFGFVSKYQNGANVPTGNTEFQFKAGNLNFRSASYDWLVVAGARAQFKGTGTINGGGNYGFMLTAIDGQINGGGGVDKFRIKIWDKNNGDAIVYDNQIGSPDGADPSTALGGGGIVIHKP